MFVATYPPGWHAHRSFRPSFWLSRGLTQSWFDVAFVAAEHLPIDHSAVLVGPASQCVLMLHYFHQVEHSDDPGSAMGGMEISLHGLSDKNEYFDLYRRYQWYATLMVM